MAQPIPVPPVLAGQVALGGGGFSLRDDRDDAASTSVIQAAAQSGIRIFDSARAYAPVGDPTHNETLLARALAGWKDVIIGTKGGHFRTGPRSWDIDNSPERLRFDVESSLRALGVEQIGLYYLHRADGRAVYQNQSTRREPIGASVQALDDLRRQGKIARIGVSNVTPDQLDEALAVAPIAAVQNRHTAVSAESADVLARCEASGITFFGYSPLRGGGTGDAAVANFPRLHDIAASRGVSLQRLLLRGLLASSPVLSVVVGAGRVATAVDAAAAVDEPWDAGADAAFLQDRSLRPSRSKIADP